MEMLQHLSIDVIEETCWKDGLMVTVGWYSQMGYLTLVFYIIFLVGDQHAFMQKQIKLDTSVSGTYSY